MENSRARTIVNAETMQGRALIVFSTGETATYSAAFLYSVLAHADAVQETDAEDQQAEEGL